MYIPATFRRQSALKYPERPILLNNDVYPKLSLQKWYYVIRSYEARIIDASEDELFLLRRPDFGAMCYTRQIITTISTSELKKLGKYIVSHPPLPSIFHSTVMTVMFY